MASLAVTTLTPDRFADAFEAHRGMLHRFLWRLTGNPTDADDLLQESFLAVWRHRDQYTGAGSLAGYLRHTAFHLFCNHRAKARRRRDLAPPPGPEPVAPAAAIEAAAADARGFLAARVRAALAELDDAPRDAFVLFRFEGLTCGEIADATGEPVKTVETRVRRATLHVAERLAPFRDALVGSER